MLLKIQMYIIYIAGYHAIKCTRKVPDASGTDTE